MRQPPALHYARSKIIWLYGNHLLYAYAFDILSSRRLALALGYVIFHAQNLPNRPLQITETKLPCALDVENLPDFYDI